MKYYGDSFMDLRSKLRLYSINNNNERRASDKDVEIDEALWQIPGQVSRRISDRVSDQIPDCLIEGLPGKTVYNDEGRIYMLEQRYPSGYLYGCGRLGDALDIKRETLELINGDSKGNDSFPAHVGVGDFLFLDTETTGLSGGTGTVAFLAGVGFFRNDEFIVRQYFMRDYDEEPAMLEELNGLLGEFCGLVTFNGRSFDWNILYGRFIQNRMKPSKEKPVNIDLLFPARRIWGMKLDSCSLASLEENILGEKRTGDIPGSLIPSIYFGFLEAGDRPEIKRVIKHNELDIISMVALLSRIADMLENPRLDSPGYELIGIGKILQQREFYNREKGYYNGCRGENRNGSEKSRPVEYVRHLKSVQCFEACAASHAYSVRADAVKQLTPIYKKSGNYSRAMKHWISMVEDSNGLSIESVIEIAKYLEHKEKDYEKALEIVEYAMASLAGVGQTGKRVFQDLKKRKERLVKKAGKSPAGKSQVSFL